jgi:hypothetical protein
MRDGGKRVNIRTLRIIMFAYLRLSGAQLNVCTVFVAALESHGPAVNLLSNSPHPHTSQAVISASPNIDVLLV